MSFHNVRFPEEISFGATGGPMRLVSIVELANGREIRTTPWQQNRRRYAIGTGIRSKADLYAVINFFEARRGALHAFRFKDWSDFQSCAPGQLVSYQDQKIGVADGIATEFQLIKTYRSGNETAQRTITKPIVETVKVGISDLECQIEKDFQVDEARGLIIFAKPPETGAPIYAGFEFDVPVRFDHQEMIVALSQFEAGEIADIALIEVFE